MTLAQRLATRIGTDGPIGFDELVEAALYDPEGGFFTTGGGAGRRGDFITSPEVGPLFGAVVARALDAWWHELDRPDPFTVVEAGAGRGALALAVRAAEPECARALTYVLVERSPALRARQAEHLPVVDLPAEAHVTGSGPRFWSAEDLPDPPITGVVLANELLDNLPFSLLERHDEAWHEVLVDVAEPGAPQLVERLAPARVADATRAEALAPGGPEGARIPLQGAARAWVAQALGRLERGRLVVVDYGTTTPELSGRPWSEWVRTYRGHERGTEPLAHPGAQDITCEVCLDQLDAAGDPTQVRTQAELLRTHGLDELVEEGRATWHQRAGVGDLAALRARSRVREAEALLDPDGLGGFLVAEWVVG